MSFYDELKRRNVLRVAAAYVVTAWLAVQVVETVFPAFGFGDAALRIVVIALIAAFVPALVLAWVFEWTPEGLKKDKDVDHERPASLQAAKRLDRMILVVLALALGYFTFDKFVLDPARDEEAIESAVEQAREMGRSEAREEVRDSSIAVLPFQDLSPAGDQAYFGDGLAVDLINQLGQVPELRVTGKTSAFSFKGRNATVPEIGEALNVGHVLEGSVSKAGDRVRVSVQLVDARQDKQLWAQTWDRTLDDIFTIRDEITFRIFDRLTIEFERLQVESLKTNPEAYDLTLQAWHLFDNASSADDHTKASELLAQALVIDPDYVPALLLSIRVNYVLSAVLGLMSEEKEDRQFDELIERVLAVDPDNGAAMGYLAWGDWESHFDFESAALRFSDALRTAPGDLELTRVAGMFARSIGYHDQSISLLERCVAADPIDTNCYFQLAQSYLWSSRPEDALKTHRKLESMTGQNGASYYVVLTLLMLNQPEAAFSELGSIPDQAEVAYLAANAMILHDLGRHEESASAFDRLTGQVNDMDRQGLYMVAQACAWVGDTDQAFKWLERAYARDERYGMHGFWFNRILFLPIWEKLHDDPRWDELRERMNLSAERLASLEFTIPEWMSLQEQAF